MPDQSSYGTFRPEIVKLARIFSSPLLLGPPMGGPLLALVDHLFTAEEAAVARHLPRYLPASLKRISRRAGRKPGDIFPVLDAMARKRVIWSSKKGYSLLPLIPGMFEYLLMDGRDSPWHRRYAQLINDLYDSGYSADYYGRPAPLIRNIPVDEEVRASGNVVDQVSMARMIEDYDTMAVLNVCQCRQSLGFTGKPCSRSTPADGCLVFGSFSDTVVERNSGRYVTKDEMRAIVRDRWEKNLVFMTANISHAGPNAICTCCDCCCHYLESVNRFGGLSSLAQPLFLAVVDETLCTACRACVQVCNTHAHGFEAEVHVYDVGRCIGCGLCVRACPTGAIALEENPAYRGPERNWLQLVFRNLHRSLATIAAMYLRR